MKTAKRKTQRQHAEEGRARESARFRSRHISDYDSNKTLAAEFIRGLTLRRAPAEFYSELLQNFIIQHQLTGDLLRSALNQFLGSRQF
jgi:hypothetical protein